MDIPDRRPHHRRMTFNPFDPGYYRGDELRAFGFGAVGENVAISKDCTIIRPEQIFLGDNIRIDSRVTIVASGGRLRMAGQNHVGGGCHLCVAADLTIGFHSGFSQGVKVYTSSDDYGGDWLAGPLVPAELRRCTMKPIVIGDYCVFGAGSVIMPGCSAADGAAVGALSLVTKPLDAWTLYHGNPARRIHARSRGAPDLAARLAGENAAEEPVALIRSASLRAG
jgi:acetyltransferase-like isoleucine patch superfamily enzyme